MLCSLSNILGFLALYIPYVYLPSMITAKGISMEKASFIVSAIGKMHVIASFWRGSGDGGMIFTQPLAIQIQHEMKGM